MIPFALLVLLSICSLFIAKRSDYVLSNLPFLITALCIFFYFANMMRSFEDIHFLINSIAVVVVVTCVIGICQYFMASSFNLNFLGGRETQLESQFYDAPITRVSGLLLHPNSLASFLNGTLPILVVYTITVNRCPLQFLHMTSLALGLITLVLTFSRGGWITFLFTLIITGTFFLNRMWRIKYRLALSHFVLLIFIIVLFFIPFLNQITIRLTKDDYGAAYSRIPLAKKALETILKNPLTGVGLEIIGQQSH